jgi:hypothetical protein
MIFSAENNGENVPIEYNAVKTRTYRHTNKHEPKVEKSDLWKEQVYSEIDLNNWLISKPIKTISKRDVSDNIFDEMIIDNDVLELLHGEASGNYEDLSQMKLKEVQFLYQLIFMS